MILALKRHIDQWNRNKHMHIQLMYFTREPRIIDRENSLFSKWEWENLNGHMQKNESRAYIIQSQKLTWIENLNMRPETITFLEEDKGKNPWHWSCQWYNIKSIVNKSKYKQEILHQIKKLLGSKQQNERQPMSWK